MRHPRGLHPRRPDGIHEDRSETREDSRSFIDEQLDALLTN